MTIQDGNLQLAVLSGAAGSWVAVEGDSFSLTLGPSLASVLTVTGTDFGFAYNSSSLGAGHEIANWAFTGLSDFQGVTLADDLIAVTGSGVEVKLGSLFDTTVTHFSLGEQQAQATTEQGGAPLQGSLFTLSLDGIGINLLNGLATITGGNVHVAIFGSGTDTWVTATGDSFSLTTTLGPITLSGTNLGFAYNSGPQGNEINDWQSVAGNAFGTDVADDLIQVSGTASVDLAGILSGTVLFGLQLQTVAVAVNRGTTLQLPGSNGSWTAGPPGPDIASATLVTVGLSIDPSTCNGGDTSGCLTVGAAGVGVSVTSGSVIVAVVTPNGSTNDTRQWVAVQASGLHASVTGIPDLNLAVDSLGLTLNSVSGTYNPTTLSTVTSQALDWTKSIGTVGAGNVFTPETVQAGGVTLNLKSTASLSIGGIATVTFAGGLVHGDLAFAVSTQTIASTALPLLLPGGATLTTIALSIPAPTVSVPSPSITIGTGPLGFTVTSGGLLVAMLTSKSTNDTRAWTAVQGDLGSATLTIPGLTLAASSLTVQYNQAGGSNTNGPATLLDWSTLPGGGVTVLDPGGYTHTISFGSTVSLSITGSATVDIAGLVSGSATFGITDTPSLTATTAGGGTVTGDLLGFTLSQLRLAVGTTSIGAQITAGTVTLAVLANNSGQSWFGLSSSGLGASLVLPDVTASVASLAIDINQASTGIDTDALNWASLGANDPFGGTLTGYVLSASGQLTNLNVFGILTTPGTSSIGVSFARSAVTGVSVGNSQTVSGTLFTFSLDLSQGCLVAGTLNGCDPTAPGFSGVGLAVGGAGTLTVATLAPTATTDSRRWIAVEGKNLAAAIVIPAVDVSVSEVDVSINGATGGAAALDWTQSALGSPGVDLTGDTLSVSGTVNLTIGGGLVTIQNAHFTISRQSVALDLNGNGILDAGDVASATLLTFSLTVPSSADGGVFTIGAGGVGFSIDGASLLVANVTAPDGGSWTAIEGSAQNASFTTPLSDLQLSVSSFTFSYNTENGTGKATSALDWTKGLDLNGDGKFGLSADQVVVAGIPPLNLTTDALAASGIATVNLFGLVSGTVAFSFSQQTVAVDPVAGTGPIQYSGNACARGPPPADLTAQPACATLTTLALTVPVGSSLYVGGPSGLVISKASLAVAILATDDGEQWTSLTGTVGSATFSSIPGVTFAVSNVTIDVNEAGGTATTALDWTKDVVAYGSGTWTSIPVTATVPTPTGPVTETFTDTQAVKSVSGSATIGLFNVVSGTVHFSIASTPVAGDFGANTSVAGTLLTLSLSLQAGDSLLVGAGGVGFQITGGSLSLAEITSTGTGDTRKWYALQTNISGRLIGVPGVSLTVQSLQVGINQASGALNGAAATALDWTQVPGSGIALAGDTTLSVSGTATGVDIFGLVSADSLSFALTTTTVTNLAVGPSQTLSSGTLTEISFSATSLFAGVAGIGFQTSGTVGVAILKSTVAGDARTWTAAYAALQSPSFVGGGSLFSISADAVEVKVNEASGTGATPLDWSTAFPGGLVIPGATSADAVTIDFSGSLLEIAAQNAKLDIAGFVHASGNFVFETTDNLYVTLAGATSTIQVSALEIGISDGRLFAGVGATDSSGTGGTGLAISDVQVGLAILKDAAGNTYTALDASGSVAAVGLPTGFQISGTLDVKVNTTSAAGGQVVDFTKLAGGGLSIPTAAGANPTTVKLAFATAVAFDVSGSLALDFANAVSVSGTFELSDQTQTINGASADVLEIGASNVQAFFGSGGGTADAIGLSLTNGSLGLLLTTIGGVHYTALKVSGGVALVGVDGVTISADNVEVDVNQASSGNALDLSGANTVTIAGVQLDFAGTLFQAKVTNATLALGGFVYVHADSLAFTEGQSLNVTLSDELTTLNNVNALTVGGTGVSVFVGINGPYQNANGTINPNAVGFEITNVSFALALLRTQDGSQSFYAFQASGASAGLVGLTAITATITSFTVAVNGSSTGALAVDFTKLPGGGLTVPGSPTPITFAAPIIEASGDLTIGIAGVSVSANVLVEKTTDSTGASTIQIALLAPGVTFGLGDQSWTLPVTGLFAITKGGVAGSLTTTSPISYSTGDTTGSGVGASFSADATIAFNTSATAVHSTFNLVGGSSQTLVLPGGPYFSATLTLDAAHPLLINVLGNKYTLSGTFALEQVNGELVIAAANVASSLTVGPVQGDLVNGSGAIIVTSGGIVGRIDATVSGSISGLSGVSAGGAVTIVFNTTGTPLEQQVTVGTTTVDVGVPNGPSSQGGGYAPIPANYWDVKLANVSIDLGGFVTLTAGSFSIDSSGYYEATNVELFFGDGPYRIGGTPSGALNPDAIGLLIDATSFKAYIDPSNSNAFAIVASGSVSLVGLDGLTLTTGTVNVRINTSGKAQAGLGFGSAAWIEEVDITGLDLSAAGIVDLSGDATFTRHPSGQVDVNIPTAQLAISVPISGTLTPVFALNGQGRFSFGGGVGFQLDSLQLNGVSIFNGQGGLNTLAITSTPPAIAPTADLASPWNNQAVDLATLNTQGYIAVQLTDNSGTGINPNSVTTSAITLGGTAAARVHFTSVTQDPNTPGLFLFHFDTTSGNGFATDPNDPYSTVTVTFNASGFADNKGDRNVASSEQFYLADVPTAKLASPKNGTTIGVDALTSRPYLDVTFVPGTDGATVDGSTINGDELTVTITPTGGGAPKTVTLNAPTLLIGNTYRYGLADPSQLVAGTVAVKFNAGSWAIILPDGTGAQSTGLCQGKTDCQLGAAGVSTFTLTPTDPNAATSSSSFSLGPLTVSGASVSLADMSMDKGTLTLAIAVGLNSATLDLGGATAQLTGITGVFELQIDLLKAAKAISDPSALLAAFSVPGEFTLGISKLEIDVPSAVNVTATGISIHIDPGADQSYGHGDPLVSVGTAQVSFPSFQGVSGGVQNLVVYSNGFTLGSADIKVAPAGGINFANLIVFNDLEVAINNFGVYHDGSGTHFLSTGPGGTSGITITSAASSSCPARRSAARSPTAPTPTQVAVSATFKFDSDAASSRSSSAPTSSRSTSARS